MKQPFKENRILSEKKKELYLNELKKALDESAPFILIRMTQSIVDEGLPKVFISSVGTMTDMIYIYHTIAISSLSELRDENDFIKGWNIFFTRECSEIMNIAEKEKVNYISATRMRMAQIKKNADKAIKKLIKEN